MTVSDTIRSTGGSRPSSKDCVMRSDLNVNGRLLRTVKKICNGNLTFIGPCIANTLAGTTNKMQRFTIYLFL